MLLPRVALGEESAICECMDRYAGLIWSLARRQLPAVEAEDAVQEIFIEIWRNASRFDQQIASEKTFIVMLARRRLIDRKRKLSREPDLEVIDDLAITNSDHESTDPLELADEAARAKNCLKNLQADHRHLLELAIYHGFSQSQISESVGSPLGTVKTRIRRGMTQLRDCMKVPSKLVGGV